MGLEIRVSLLGRRQLRETPVDLARRPSQRGELRPLTLCQRSGCRKPATSAATLTGAAAAMPLGPVAPVVALQLAPQPCELRHTPLLRPLELHLQLLDPLPEPLVALVVAVLALLVVVVALVVALVIVVVAAVVAAVAAAAAAAKC